MATARALILLPIMLAAGPAPDDIQEIRIRSGPYAPAPATFAVQTNLVELGVTVKDRKGEPVGGLKAGDFELADNGKPQAITFFSEQKSAPQAEPIRADSPAASGATPAAAVRSIVLFFDDTHNTAMGLQKGREAARKFLTEGAQPGDHFAILTTSGNPAVDFTADTKALLAALNQLKEHPDIGARGLNSCPALNPYQAYAIDHYLNIELKQAKVAEAIVCNCGPQPELVCIQEQDTVVQSAAATAWSIFKPQSAAAIDRLGFAVRHLATAPGSRVLVMVSSGFPSGDLEQQISGVMDAAIRAHIVINALDSIGLSTDRRQGAQSMVLDALMADAAISTGGQFIHNNNDLPGGLRRLAEPAPVSYVLGFSPTSAPDDKYHPLKVKLKDNPGDRVESRPGYFPAPPEKPRETIQQRIDRLAASKDTLQDVKANVQVTAHESVIEVDISVAAKELKFSEQGDRHVQQLTFVTMILDRDGNLLEGKQAVMDLALGPAKLAEILEKNIETTTSFSLPKGAYQVREVIREAMQNRMTAVNTAITTR
jgi:VWFA-related protein